MRSAVVRVIASAIALLCLAACTGSAGSHSSPSLTDVRPSSSASAASTSATPTAQRTGPLTTGPGVRPGEKPPDFPAIAREHTGLGAEQFAEYYLKALDWGVATNDMYLLEKISAPTCRACRRNIDGAARLKREGRRQISGRSTLIDLSDDFGSYGIRADHVYRVISEDDPVVIEGPGTALATALPAQPRDVSLIFVSWAGTLWQVAEETSG